MKDYLLGIDVGSYESKGVIVTTDGVIAASASIGHTISFPKEGYAEHDADKIWWHDFVYLCRQLINSSGIDASQILSVGVSGIGQCVLPVDENGKPLRPAILYGIDNRCKKEVQEIIDLFGEDEIFANSGNAVDTHTIGPRLLWLKKHEPDVFEKAGCFFNSNSYLVYRLTGEKVIDVYSASDSVPFFNINNISWNPDMTTPVIPVEKLPRILWSTDPAGSVTKEAAAETGLKEGTIVVAGTTDAGTEALASGVSRNDDCMIMIGSSVFFVQKTKQLTTDKDFWGCYFLQKDTHILAAAMNTGGSLTRWYRDQFCAEELTAEKNGGLNAYAAMENLLSRSVPGANGLIAFPYFFGERFLLHDPDLRGAFLGLGLNHTKADIYRALIESICYGIRNNLTDLAEKGYKAKRFFAIGGGTKNAAWMQILADINQIELTIPIDNPGACYGDAFIAGIGAGIFSNLSEIDRWKQETKKNLSRSGCRRILYRLL